MTLKLTIKKGIASLLQVSGALNQYCKHNQAIVLMYHRVGSYRLKDRFVQPGMYVHTDTLKNHLLVLKKKFTLLSLPDLLNRINDGESCAGHCLLTFDDGWLDNYTDAFPLLYKYKVPATIFLTTGYIGTDCYFWPEEIMYYLGQIHDAQIPKINLLLRLIAEITIKEKNDRFYDQAVEILKRWSPSDREELLKDLRKNCHFLPLERQMMNWDEVKKMQASGLITFGAHTANHVILDQVSLAEAEHEILQSRKDIKNHLGIFPEFFAYPNGNYTLEIKEILKKHGFKAATTTNRGKVENDVDPFEIPRIGMHEDVSNTESMFLARMNYKWF